MWPWPGRVTKIVLKHFGLRIFSRTSRNKGWPRVLDNLVICLFHLESGYPGADQRTWVFLVETCGQPYHQLLGSILSLSHSFTHTRARGGFLSFALSPLHLGMVDRAPLDHVAEYHFKQIHHAVISYGVWLVQRRPPMERTFFSRCLV